MKHQIYGKELANMPYEKRPEGCDSAQTQTGMRTYPRS